MLKIWPMYTIRVLLLISVFILAQVSVPAQRKNAVLRFMDAGFYKPSALPTNGMYHRGWLGNLQGSNLYLFANGIYVRIGDPGLVSTQSDAYFLNPQPDSWGLYKIAGDTLLFSAPEIRTSCLRRNLIPRNG